VRQPLLDRLTEVYGAARDPVRAAAMAAYMRDQFPFLGLPAPRQRELSRQVLAGMPVPAEDDLRAVALACWALPEREYQYFACGYLRRHVKVCAPDFLGTVQELLTTKPWWDTVDALASNVAGPLVLRHPELVPTLDDWITGNDLWLIRAALIHQLTFKQRTDAPRLFGYCRLRAEHPDFFVRKAIGWALRQYAKTDPEAVRRFVADTPLSPLSRREALKNL
jgi:3-methyladenine DNA glycosylase AlkD